MPLLSVIVPVYNEAVTVKEILDKIYSVPIDKEVIVVDDGSTDGTDRILRGIRHDNLKVIHHATKRGKGSGVLTGFSQADGKFIIIQDADLEYDPGDYPGLIKPVEEGRADLVLGVRFNAGYRGVFIHMLGNIFLTGLVNLLFGTRLSDCFTCYKVMRTQDMKSLGLRSKSFDIEIEIIAKAIRRKMRLAQVPVNYRPRTYSEGKKIRLMDGFWAMLRIFRFRMG